MCVIDASSSTPVSRWSQSNPGASRPTSPSKRPWKLWWGRHTYGPHKSSSPSTAGTLPNTVSHFVLKQRSTLWPYNLANLYIKNQSKLVGTHIFQIVCLFWRIMENTHQKMTNYSMLVLGFPIPAIGNSRTSSSIALIWMKPQFC